MTDTDAGTFPLCTKYHIQLHLRVPFEKDKCVIQTGSPAGRTRYSYTMSHQGFNRGKRFLGSMIT
jgi:hypothetical protein